MNFSTWHGKQAAEAGEGEILWNPWLSPMVAWDLALQVLPTVMRQNEVHW